MKIRILIVLFVLCQSVWAQIKIDSIKTISVLSFNIFHGETTRGDFDLDVIAKVIIEADPDFVDLIFNYML
jgi:hypothetical protein